MLVCWLALRAVFLKGFFSGLCFPYLKNNAQSNKLLLWHISKRLPTSTSSTTISPTSNLPMFTYRFLICKCLGFFLGFYLWLAPFLSRTRPIVSLRSSGPRNRCFSHLHPRFFNRRFWVVVLPIVGQVALWKPRLFSNYPISEIFAGYAAVCYCFGDFVERERCTC